jgi:hypothetical protein
MGDLYNIFEVDPSLDTGKRLWHCFFGCFDAQTGWAVRLENMWMEKKKLGYRYNISVRFDFVYLFCNLTFFSISTSIFIHRKLQIGSIKTALIRKKYP